MPAIIIAVTGLIAAIIPLIIFFVIVTHLQALNAEAEDLAKIGGVAIGEAVAPVVTGSLVVFGGTVLIAGLGYVLVKALSGENIPPPSFAPIAAPQPQFASNIGFSGGGFNVGGGGVPGFAKPTAPTRAQRRAR